jgi:hypothetical protein
VISEKICTAIAILEALGLPRAQLNERSTLCLLALLNLSPAKKWSQAENPLPGITPIMDWIRTHYQKDYAPNTRETVRRQTMHQFVAAGIVIHNPDQPVRAVNSPKAVYQIIPEALALLRGYGSRNWKTKLTAYLSTGETLTQRYASKRLLDQIPVQIVKGKKINLSPGAHNALIKAVIEDFAPRFAPGCTLIYAGDTGKKWGYFDQALLKKLGVDIDPHGKMPDVVFHFPQKNWLLIVEAVTSHGPVDGKRYSELRRLFADSKSGLVYVTAFPDRSLMARYVTEIAWETEVWIADAPSHLIHFNGVRFLGPYG